MNDKIRNPQSATRNPYRGAIRILGMRFAARHGVYPEERALPRPFEVDVEVTGDFTRPARTDDLADTLDYGRIAAAVREVMEGEPAGLLERLAGAIIERIRPLAPKGGMVTVRVRKTCAPLDVAFDTVEVELTCGVDG